MRQRRRENVVLFAAILFKFCPKSWILEKFLEMTVPFPVRPPSGDTKNPDADSTNLCVRPNAQNHSARIKNARDLAVGWCSEFFWGFL